MLAGPHLAIREEYALARRAAQKSLELNENLAQAHSALAFVQMIDDWDWPGAESNFRRALELDPNDANTHHWYAQHPIGMKRPQEAIREIRRAMELDPLSLGISYNGGFIYMLAGLRPEAEQQLKVTAVSEGFHGAMWLSAATLDRYLHSIRQPQVFGTQFGSLYDSSDNQGSYDTAMLSDPQPRDWCVASVSAQMKIPSSIKAGKAPESTRICPLP
jgi:tetratricopeptide (TPR) repeat protein